MPTDQKPRRLGPEPTDAPSSAILTEARGAHSTAREILDLMTATGDGAPPDPIEEITATLRDLLRAVHGITARLDAIEQMIRSGSRG